MTAEELAEIKDRAARVVKRAKETCVDLDDYQLVQAMDAPPLARFILSLPDTDAQAQRIAELEAQLAASGALATAQAEQRFEHRLSDGAVQQIDRIERENVAFSATAQAVTLTEEEREQLEDARYHAEKYPSEWWSEAILELIDIIEARLTNGASTS